MAWRVACWESGRHTPPARVPCRAPARALLTTYCTLPACRSEWAAGGAPGWPVRRRPWQEAHRVSCVPCATYGNRGSNAASAADVHPASDTNPSCLPPSAPRGTWLRQPAARCSVSWCLVAVKCAGEPRSELAPSSLGGGGEGPAAARCDATRRERRMPAGSPGSAGTARRGRASAILFTACTSAGRLELLCVGNRAQVESPGGGARTVAA